MNPVLRSLPFVLGIAIVLLLGALIFIPAPKKNTLNNPTPALMSYTTKQDKPFQVSIHQNDQIKSPLTLRGVAQGWYFEGSFPIKVLDANNKLLGQGIATAQTDWMTSNPVPFAAHVQFNNSSTTTGTLLLTNDNPSDMRQYDDEVRIPVRF